MTTHGNVYRRQCAKTDDFMILFCNIASYIWSQKIKSTRKPIVKVRIAQNSHYSSTKILTPPQKNFVEYIFIDINYLPDDSYNDPPTIWKGSPTLRFQPAASPLQRPWRRFSFGPRTVRRWHRPTSPCLPQGEWHEDTKAMAQALRLFAHCFLFWKKKGQGMDTVADFLLTGIWNLGFVVS